MNRRGFLGSILALGVAPAVARAEWLMPVRVLVPQLTIESWHGPVPFDFGNWAGLAVQLSDGRRQAVRTFTGHRPVTPLETALMREKLRNWALEQGAVLKVGADIETGQYTILR